MTAVGTVAHAVAGAGPVAAEAADMAFGSQLVPSWSAGREPGEPPEMFCEAFAVRRGCDKKHNSTIKLR